MEEWREITGQQLLERYGKTELGMVLSDPIEVEARKSGFVGNPMPGVQVRVVKPGSAGEPGNILLMGDNDGTTILQVLSSSKYLEDTARKKINTAQKDFLKGH